MIAESYNAVLSLGLWDSYLLSVLPVFLFMLLCLRAKTQTQINVAAVMSAVYTIVMLLVTVGTIINVATANSIVSPDVLFLLCVVAIFVVAGLVHPNELFCLFHGVLYYLTVPSTFVFLTVFFLCNMHVVSWGTREGPKKADPAQENQPPPQERGRLYKLLEKMGLTAVVQDIRTFAQQMMGARQDLENVQQESRGQEGNENSGTPPPPTTTPTQPAQPAQPAQPDPPPKPKPDTVLEADPTYWTRAMDEDVEVDVPNSTVGEISRDETDFWKFLIDEYLHPIKANKDQQDKISADLISARNNVLFGYMLVNLMFTLVLLQLRLQTDKLKDTFFIAGEYEPVSTVSLAIFSLLLLTQFFGMLSHRWGTFLHLIASTRLAWLHGNEEEERALTAIQEAQKLTAASAEGDIDLLMNPDYSDDDDDDIDYTTTRTAPSTSASSTTTSKAGITSYDLSTVAEDPGGEVAEDAPDYSDSEDAPDYSDSEGEEEERESELEGRAPVQYDTVFNRRFRTVRKHMELQTRPPLATGHSARTPLYQKRQTGVVGGGGGGAGYRTNHRPSRHVRQYERRQSLYMSARGAPWGGRGGGGNYNGVLSV